MLVKVTEHKVFILFVYMEVKPELLVCLVKSWVTRNATQVAFSLSVEEHMKYEY